MRTRAVLTDEDVTKVADAAIAHALANEWKVTISIVDDGGHLLYLRRLDGAPAISSEVTPGKARTAALGRRESRVFEEMIREGRTAFLSAPLTAMPETPTAPITSPFATIGAVGVSGVKSDQDAAIAKAGIKALNLE